MKAWQALAITMTMAMDMRPHRFETVFADIPASFR
jgi:hypothetical protein